MATRGRKTKLTPELLDRLSQALSAGNYVETACAYAGISQSVYYAWVTEAKKPNAKKIYMEFMDTIERAKSVAEIRNLQIVQSAAQGDVNAGKDPEWRAATWFLERAYPRKWGRHERVELSGADGAPINLAIDTKEALLEIIREKTLKTE